jgi:hypothetical protein
LFIGTRSGKGCLSNPVTLDRRKDRIILIRDRGQRQRRNSGGTGQDGAAS